MQKILFSLLLFFVFIGWCCQERQTVAGFKKIDTEKITQAVKNFYWSECRPNDKVLDIDADTASYNLLQVNNILDLKRILTTYKRITSVLKLFAKQSMLTISPSEKLYIQARRSSDSQERLSDVSISNGKNFEIVFFFNGSNIENRIIWTDNPNTFLDEQAFFREKKCNCSIQNFPTSSYLDIFIILSDTEAGAKIDWLAIRSY